MAKYKLMTLQINSTDEPVKKYITKRYERWMDYSRFKCDKAGMKGKECEVLSEVIYSLLKRDENFLLKLYNAKKVQKGIEYKELDFFVLRAIDLNVNSETSPYRYQNRPIPVNSNAKLERLKLVDETEPDEDIPARILKEMRLINWVLKGLELTELERSVFEFKFLHGNSLRAYCQDIGTIKQKYKIYNEVESTIHHVLYFYGLTNLAPKKECTNRQAELAEAFIKSHKVKTNKKVKH